MSHLVNKDLSDNNNSGKGRVYGKNNIVKLNWNLTILIFRLELLLDKRWEKEASAEDWVEKKARNVQCNVVEVEADNAIKEVLISLSEMKLFNNDNTSFAWNWQKSAGKTR